jgi:Family of unknown function (DUF6011)
MLYRTPVPVATSGLIETLLGIIEQAKRPRFPKWRFKVDEDVGLDMQGKPRVVRRRGWQYTSQYLLEGDIYTPLSRDRKDERYTKIGFAILPDEDGNWLLKSTVEGSAHALQLSLLCSRLGIVAANKRYHPDRYDAAEHERLIAERRPIEAEHEKLIRALYDRLLAVFNGQELDKLTPGMMLQLNCLICGRGLTDPESRRRWIGPECATKWHVPQLAPHRFDLMAERAENAL